MALGGYRALQQAGVRGISMSGAPDTTYQPKRATTASQPIYVVAAFGEDHANEMFDMVSHLGVAKKVRVASKHDLGGMNDQIAKKLAGEE
jgi:hypothetical protein